MRASAKFKFSSAPLLCLSTQLCDKKMENNGGDTSFFDNWCVKTNPDWIFLNRTHPERRSRSEEFVSSGRVRQRRSAAELSLGRLQMKMPSAQYCTSDPRTSTNKCVP